ncbi:MAG TPA: ATP-binding protein [Candidatus Dormibacteraeota bacterium]|nr:ATP-binding protein [Candidatus Dormibacteraeota bacterium]
MRRGFVPIRIKITIALLLVTTAVVSVITFTMANLFHRDKQAYINDLAAIVALNDAEETRSLLLGYVDRLQAYALILGRTDATQGQRSELLSEFFRDFPALVAVAFYENGKEVAAAYDAETLKAAGLSRLDVQTYRRNVAIPMDRVAAGEIFIENSTLSQKLPALTLAVAHRIEGTTRPAIVVGMISLDALLRLGSRSGVFEVFVVDRSGTLLSHPDARRVGRRESIALPPEAATLQSVHSAGIALEYDQGGTGMIGGFASLELGGLIAVAQIPKTAAYLASRDLLNRLLFAALGLLVATALTGLFWSRRFTRPVEQLSGATREIASGKFDVQVQVTSSDEIGGLAVSFNRMASELRAREAALQEAHARLLQSEKLAAVGQLGAGIAHEVKNPLAGILGCAQLSLRKAERGTPLEKNLLLIEKETKRCKTIIDNLLRFARQEKTVLEPIEVNRVVEDAIAIISHQLGLQQVKISQQLAPDLPMVRGHADQLQQVLMNLMINAQDALEGSPGTVTITTTRADADRIEVRVTDTGPGIPKEIQGKLFEPFFTTKPRGKGTGLGLAVTYGIVKDHGGEIRLLSEPGHGATFIITLPLARADDDSKPASSGAGPDGPAVIPAAKAT